MEDVRSSLKKAKRVVVKVGSSTLVHEETGFLDYGKLEQLVRILCDIRNQGKNVILVSSGAIGVGVRSIGLRKRPDSLPLKQACAAVGQAQLMMIYQKLFSEYHQQAGQILLTKRILTNDNRRVNASNTFNELLRLGIIPVVNENDSVSTEEIEFGDNDTLSAIVTSLTNADLLILLSDIDGLYTDDPHLHPEAKLIEVVTELTKEFLDMAKDPVTSLGTGGMITKFEAAKIATSCGADMVIANGADVTSLNRIINGDNVGTLFVKKAHEEFDLKKYLMED